jgi:uncharacterized protein (DUF302 family)
MIGFEVARCNFEIEINNVPLFTMNVKGKIGMEIPCNYLILESGEQQLEIIIQPCIGETELDKNLKFTAKVQLYDVTKGFDFEYLQDDIKFAMSDEDKTGAMSKHTMRFNAQVPYKMDVWQNSVDLNTVENLHEKLVSAYQKIVDMITQKHYDAFANSMQEREKRMAASMYLSKEQSDERMNELIEDFKNGFEAIPLSGTETMHIYAEGKLAALKTEDDESALRFHNRETGEELTIDVLFHIKAGNTELTIAP